MPFYIFLNHIDLVIGQVTCEHMAASLQKLSYMGALATRCCAYIYHIVALLWSSRLCDKHGADILHIEKSVSEALQAIQIIKSRYNKRVIKFINRCDRHTLCLKYCTKLIRSTPGQVCPDANCALIVKGLENLLCLLLSVCRNKSIHYPLWHGVSDA